ncbi:MAG: rhomboid family intramembrane serine protease [Saprospiraceae bacterium]
MLESIWADVKHSFRFGNMVTRLIFINAAVFIFINLILLILKISNAGNTPEVFYDIVHFFSISSSWKHNLTHPWVFFTHMFLHKDFWHILWNMLYLYWFGRILGDLLGDRHILPAYLLGGLFGGLVYFLAAVAFPGFGLVNSYALGASAAVMAIVVASGVAFPDYTLHLLFLGPVRLKYIVFVLVLLDLIAVTGTDNTGGHIAHLGGAFFGYLYVSQMRSRGIDWSIPVNRTLDSIADFFKNIFQPSRKPKVVYRNKSKMKTASGNQRTDKEPVSSSHQEKLDQILDKIKQKGYESLSAEEKEFLFNASKK